MNPARSRQTRDGKGNAAMDERTLWTRVPAGEDDDIRILDLDVARTTWSRVHESMRVVHLRLNRQPDALWIRFFHEERESRIGLRRRGLWIEDGCIAFDCLTHEVESHHLPDIRRSLDHANARQREQLAARRRERADGAAAGQAELRELQALRDRLRAALGAPKQAQAPPTPPAARQEAPPSTATEPAPPATPAADAAIAAAHDAALAAARTTPVPRPKSGADGIEETLDAFRRRLRDASARATVDPPKKPR